MRLVMCAAPVGSAGAGHLGRVLAVAEEAVARGWSVVVAADPTAPPWLTSLSHDSGADLVAPGPPLGLLRGEGAEVLLVDGYDFDADLRAGVHARGGLLVSVEDGTYGRRPADLVVDPGIGAEASARPDDGSAVVLRGSDLVLIRRAVRTAIRNTGARRRRGPETGTRVLVVMGGTDPAKLADLVSGIVAGLGPGIHTERADGAHLPDQLATVDVVVSAAGVTALEACCIGTPLAVVQVAGNQQRNYAELIRSGNAVGLGTSERVRRYPAEVAAELSGLINGDTRLDPRPLVDGRGAQRLCDAIGELCA